MSALETVDNSTLPLDTLKDRILKLKKEKNALIMAH